MSEVHVSLTVSVDGFVAGPNQSVDNPMGEGTSTLHAWLFASDAFRESHGLPPEGDGTPAVDAVVFEEMLGASAFVMGRNMFGGGPGPWNTEEPWNGWWGEEPPYHAPVFVLTHYPREPLTLGDTTFTFVTDGIESAIAQAKEAAGDGYVSLAGGAKAIQQGLVAGLVDEIQVNISPVILGAGERLFDNLGTARPQLTIDRVIDAPGVTHVKYRVTR
jgi:dihydrofolate reductase